MWEINGFADERLARSKSQEISEGSAAMLIKQAVEFSLVDFLHKLFGQLQVINQLGKQLHFLRVFLIVRCNYAQNHEH